jgi:hypothetical protein
MTDKAGLIGLLHRADWTTLRLSARLSDGSTVVIAPGKRYRFETAGYLTGCDGGRPWHLLDEDDDDDDGEVHWFGGLEPSVPRLLRPAWLLEGFELEVRGRVWCAAARRWTSWLRRGRISATRPKRPSMPS